MLSSSATIVAMASRTASGSRSICLRHDAFWRLSRDNESDLARFLAAVRSLIRAMRAICNCLRSRSFCDGMTVAPGV